MKTKEKKEIGEKTKEELKNLWLKAKEELFTLKIEHSRRKLKNTRAIFMKRKDIARILTVLKRKELQNESV